MRAKHCTHAAVVLAAMAASSTARAQQPPAGSGTPATSTFSIFAGNTQLGTEDVVVSRGADGWTIVSSGRIGAPIDIITRRFEAKYDPNWKPIELTLDLVVRSQEQMLHSVVRGNGVEHEVTLAGQTRTVTTMGPVDVFLPNTIFASYEAIAERAKTAPAGTTILAMVTPQVTASIRIGDSMDERIATSRETIDTRRTHLTMSAQNGAATAEADIWADQDGHLLRLTVPAQGVTVTREDLAASTTRLVPVSRPNDEQIKIPGPGFMLAGTVSKPANAAAGARLPAVVLVGGSGATDRDELVAGIPVMGEIANALSDAGFLTLRFDKRGVGQSGGRLESSTIDDYAEDVRAAVKLLSERKDVDPRRIAVVGHSEGGAVALIAAAKDKRIDAVALLAANGVRGADLILDQQRHALDRTTLTDAEKEAKVAEQKRIHEAVITGKGWDQFPPAVRRQADNAEFQSILLNDPAKVVPGVRQPLLILQGLLDTQVSPSNADRLEQLARQRKGMENNPAAVQVVKLPRINHLLALAATGEVDEYGSLPDKHVNAAVTAAIINWLQATLK